MIVPACSERQRPYELTRFPIALREDDPEGADKAFRAIIDAQTEKGDW
jgi:hypothetical protein